jgi:hypothetical protein
VSSRPRRSWEEARKARTVWVMPTWGELALVAIALILLWAKLEGWG